MGGVEDFAPNPSTPGPSPLIPAYCLAEITRAAFSCAQISEEVGIWRCVPEWWILVAFWTGVLVAPVIELLRRLRVRFGEWVGSVFGGGLQRATVLPPAPPGPPDASQGSSSSTAPSSQATAALAPPTTTAPETSHPGPRRRARKHPQSSDKQ